jgi:transposase
MKTIQIQGVWMAKKYRFYDHNQTLMISPNLDDWLSKNHIARFINDVVDGIDISPILEYYECELKGGPPYDPRMMVKVRMYSDAIGMPSSRKIADGMYDDMGLRFLGAGNFPDFRTISDFRKIHHENMAGLFLHVLELCKQAGLVKMGTVAIDGTKVKANASKDKNYTIDTLKKKENELEKIARKIIEDGIKVDEEEDRIFGPDNKGYGMPDDALERIRKAQKELEEKKRTELEEYETNQEERSRIEEETGKKLRGRKPKHPNQMELDLKTGKKKEPTANTTDPDSRLMKTRNGFIQGYNAQASVDADTHIILAAEVTQDCNDKRQLVPMLNKTRENTGINPKHATFDAGYDNEEQISQYRNRIDLYIPTQKDWKQRKSMREQPPPQGRIPNNLSFRERMERKLLTKKGKKIYKKRGCSVETVFGNIKSTLGLDKFLLRGIEKCDSEWKMYCMAHNILKLWRNSVKSFI